MSIRWLPVAADSRRKQIAYIARHDPRAALETGDRIRSSVGLLRRHPSLGRPGRRPGTRELVVSGLPSPIVPRVEGDVVTILRLFHGAQDWPDMP